MDKSFLIKLITVLIANAAPEIVDGLRATCQEWYVKSKATSNPFDELLPWAILLLLGKAPD